MKFICPTCSWEVDPPSASIWSDGKIRVVNISPFQKTYIVHCTCYKCGKTPLGFSFDVEISKDQAKRLNEEAAIKRVTPMGRVVE